MSAIDNIRQALRDQQKAESVEALDRVEAQTHPQSVTLTPGQRLQRDQLVTIQTADMIAACDLVGGTDEIAAALRKGSVAAGTCPEVMVRVRDVLHLLSLEGGKLWPT